MAHLEELPLFPLHTVLFPYAPIQLHIFEDRYREMVRNCLDFDLPFGVVLIRSGSEIGPGAETYMVGTAARIENIHHYDDGRMDIMVRGQNRFRVRKFDTSKPYMVGMVEPVVELEPENEERVFALATRAQESFRLWIESAFSRPDMNVHVQFPTDSSQISFLIANLLPAENLVKQQLLETTDTAQRLTDLIPLIERQIIEARSQALYKLDARHMTDWINPN